MNDSYPQELKIAADAVRQAALVCEAVQKSISRDAVEKKDKSPVTVADYASQAVICRALQAAFPNDPIIAEEDAAELRSGTHAAFRERVAEELRRIGIAVTGNEACDWIDRGRTGEFRKRFWTLDPIDGTKGFLRGEQYAISLALIVDGKIKVAAVGCPNLSAEPNGQGGSLFLAVDHAGATVQPLHDTAAKPRTVRVSEVAVGSAAKFCESVESGHSAHDASAVVAQTLGIQLDPVRMDSQAKYGTVADGRAEIYLRLPTRPGYVEKIWDHAGGVLVVEEAGGRVTDVDGVPLDFAHGRGLEKNRGVIVTNGALHDEVLRAVRAAGV